MAADDATNGAVEPGGAGGMGVGDHYRRGRERLSGLLATLGEDEWRAPVPACPGWQVHDVLGHLLGVVEDVAAGRLAGIPTQDQTAEQVARHRGGDRSAMLARWGELAPTFEDLVTAAELWPPAFDLMAHEQDVRGALGRPGARDDAAIVSGARLMVEGLEVDGTIEVHLLDQGLVVHSAPRPGPRYTLRTTAFEVFRFRLGRRTRDQVAALDWSPAPGDVVDELFFFGPAEAPIVE